jgi:hypothetical protein
MLVTTLLNHAGDGAAEPVLVIARQGAITGHQGATIDYHGATTDRQSVIADHQGATEQQCQCHMLSP